LDGMVTRQAVTIAYLNDFRLMLYLTVLAVPLLLLIRPPKRAGRAAAPPVAAAAAE
jgi:MFS transporter, DHA2 family, multidrug resistance protein